MSDPSKTSSSFSFGTPATSGGNSLFGNVGSGNNTGASSAFGSASNTSSTPSLFGSTPSTSTPAQQSMFGSTTTPASTQKPLFGAIGSSSTPGQQSSQSTLFGSFGGGAGAGVGASSSGQNAPSLFATPNKGADGGTALPTLFGAASTGGTNPFGSFGGGSSSSAIPGTTTPAASKPGIGLGNLSTTPAGPPPAATAGSGSAPGLFAPKPSIFGGPQPAQGSAPAASGSSAPANPFASISKPSGGPLFGGNSGTPSSQPAPISFGTAPTGNTPQPTNNLFANLNKTPGTSNPANSGTSTLFGAVPTQTPSTGTSQPSGASTLFPSISANVPKASPFPPSAQSATNTPSVPITTTTSTASGTPSLFGGPTVGTPSAAPSANQAPGLFSSTPSAAPPSGSIPNITGGFALPKVPASSGASTSAPAAPTAFATTSAAAPASFGATPTFGAAPSSTQSGAQPNITSNTAPDANKAALGASTAGPKPPPQSRLKNQSMDEIITRWASDLSKYQKEFQKQAAKVAEWDRMLVDNSDKIHRLYGSTLEAERATVEVERQLSSVENDQAELEYWLDHYEKQVDEIMSSQVGEGDSVKGPDQDRVRTLDLAKTLSERLDEMGKDLTSMIEEINDASSTLSKNNKPDDPLSNIVRVLNGHLSQLQQIDQGTAALQAKVNAAQNISRGLNSSTGPNGFGSNSADDFYRSYMGGRR